MSSLDGLSLNERGFVDMDQFPDDSDLSAEELDSLQAALLSDPVVEPSDAEWDAMFDSTMEVSAEDGPFAVDPAVDDLDPAEVVDDDLDPAVTDPDLDDPDDSPADGDDPLTETADDDLDPTDLDLGADEVVDPFDDGSLDLTPPDDSGPVDPDGFDDVPADIANNDFEDLL